LAINIRIFRIFKKFAAEIACREVYFFASWYGPEGRPLLFDMLNMFAV
jgi:hypothetical protein